MFINQVDHHYHIHYKAHQNKHPSFSVLAQKNLIIEKLLYTPKYCALTQVGTAQKMKFSIKDFFSECDQIRSFLRGSVGTNAPLCCAKIGLFLVQKLIFHDSSR